MTAPEHHVAIEDDPTPLVLVIGRALRATLPITDISVLREANVATVTIQSKDDPQAVTIVFGETTRVSHGRSEAAETTLVVDLGNDFSFVSAEGIQDAAVIDVVLALLEPSRPDWQEAAASFWSLTSGDQGMPSSLVVRSSEDDVPFILGEGTPRYVIAASPDDLSRLFSGSVSFLDAVFAGAVKIQGTLPQFSVMAGASNKVRFNV